jgi:hypothetical protein
MIPLLGFTGTRYDLTNAQRGGIYDFMVAFPPRSGPAELAHGDRVNGDAWAHGCGMDLGYIVHVHPPISARYRAYCTGHHNHRAASYRTRNWRIATHCSELLAAPLLPEADSPRSGTWMTVRMARSLGKPITLVWPDGRTEEDTGGQARDGDGGQRGQSGQDVPGAEAGHRTEPLQ